MPGVHQTRTTPALLTLSALAFSTLSAQADVITDWNQILMNAIRADRTAPPKAARAMAMTHTAMFDAVNAVSGSHTGYLYSGPTLANASKEAAAATAAHRVLTSIYGPSAAFDAQLASHLASVTNTAARTRGISLGTTAADLMLDARSADGSANAAPYTPGTNPGAWRPVGSGNAILPNWGSVTPFTLSSPAQFRRSGMPDLASDQYAQEWDQVRRLGAATGSERTDDQTAIAHFWVGGPGTVTPPGQWNDIARQVSSDRALSLDDNARLFATLGLAVADAGIAAWDMKYHYNTWRPITAIHEADADGNDQTFADPTWTPLLSTPNHPDYVSGHSTFSAAAATALASFFGEDRIAFTYTSEDTGTARSFNGFWEAAEEAGMSRIYGGIHTMTANLHGLYSGCDVANWITTNYFQTIPAPAPLSALALVGLAASRRRR
jgi:hypothetical protein